MFNSVQVMNLSHEKRVEVITLLNVDDDILFSPHSRETENNDSWDVDRHVVQILACKPRSTYKHD